MNINGGTVRVSVVRVCTRREGAVADAILKLRGKRRGEERWGFVYHERYDIVNIMILPLLF